MCMHYFHPLCIKEWFNSKASESEKKCPLCNKIMEIELLKTFAAQNKDVELFDNNQDQPDK